MLYEVRDCCNNLIAMISSLEELEKIKQKHSCYTSKIDSLYWNCGSGNGLELHAYQVDDNNGDPDEAYEKAVEYYLDMESLSVQWEQACRDDPELLDK